MFFHRMINHVNGIPTQNIVHGKSFQRDMRKISIARESREFARFARDLARHEQNLCDFYKKDQESHDLQNSTEDNYCPSENMGRSFFSVFWLKMRFWAKNDKFRSSPKFLLLE